MKKINCFSYLLLLFVISIHWAYAGTGHQGKTGNDEKLKKIMILFLGKNFENRKLLENELTYYVNDKGFDAEPSIKYLPGTKLPDREEVISSLQKNGFDGILLVQLIDLEVKKEWVNAKLKYGNEPINSVFFTYYDLSLQYTPGYSTTEFDYEVESTLFRTSDHTNLFSTTSNVYEKQSLDMAMESFAKHIANQLKKSKTILKTK